MYHAILKPYIVMIYIYNVALPLQAINSANRHLTDYIQLGAKLQTADPNAVKLGSIWVGRSMPLYFKG